VLAYLWTLTFGGRKTLPDEYRIQMTAVRPPLEMEKGGLTAVLGYEPDLQVFAGFDVQRHRVFSTGSPSVQIPRDALRRAVTCGLSTTRKSNGEVVCGIRADCLLAYVVNSHYIHRSGRRPSEFAAYRRAVETGKVRKADLQSLSAPRRRAVRDVARWSRDSRFRGLVLQAYDNRCAATGLQLRLVDAAHILPVGAPASTDEVSNGIALSPTYHRAFDSGLIYLGEDLKLHVSQTKVEELHRLALSEGLDTFKRPLAEQIVLPSNPSLRPSPDYIRRANRFRGVVA